MKRWRKLYKESMSFVCPYCQKLVPITEATVEHEPPQSRQKELGQKSQTFIVCAKCNHEKGALTLEEYRQWLHLECIRNGRNPR